MANWNEVAFQVRADELHQRAYGLSKLRAREWRKQQLVRGDTVSASQLNETRRDLAQCALGELWERFDSLQSASLEAALDSLDALKLRFLPAWGQPEREQEQSFYVPPEAYEHFSDKQRALLAMAVCGMSNSEQLRLLGRAKNGRNMRALQFEQLEALATALAVCDLAAKAAK